MSGLAATLGDVGDGQRLSGPAPPPAQRASLSVLGPSAAHVAQ